MSMNNSTEKSFLKYITLGLSIVFVILGVIVAFRVITTNTYVGGITPTERDLYSLSRGAYSEVADLNRKSLYSKDEPSESVAEGLAVGQYFDDSILAEAALATGNTEKASKYQTRRQNAKSKMGSYSNIAEKIDKLIATSLENALNRGN